MDIVTVIIVALVAEAVWETLKMVWDNGKVNADRIGAIIISVIVAVSAGADIFSLVGLPLNVPYVGMIFTGLIASRGANFVHDIYSKIGGKTS
jgi:hypothetical protein